MLPLYTIFDVKTTRVKVATFCREFTVGVSTVEDDSVEPTGKQQHVSEAFNIVDEGKAKASS